MKKNWIFGMSILINALPVFAISDAAKIGANSGAMTFCKENIAASEDRGKYGLLGLKTLGEYNELSSEDKLKALIFKKSAEDGEYLGDPLTEDRCNSIRKLLFLRYSD